ncbi:MAG: beta-galactosidase [Fimbriimonadaceae bacterium]
MRAATWALLLSVFATATSFGQIQNQDDLLDADRFDDPDYFSLFGCTLTFDQSQGGPTIHATSLEEFGGLARRTQTPANWSNYDSMSFVLKNRENRTVNFKLRVEATTDTRDMSKIVQASFAIPANAEVTIDYDLRLERARALGLWGRPPIYNTPHRRLYAPRPIDMTQIFGWRLSVADTGVARFTVSRMKLITRTQTNPGIVDQFGQYDNADWTNKVRSTEDLTTQRTAEQADLAANPGPGNYEGSTLWPGLNRSNRWRTYRTPSGKWYLVHPSGKLFWSMGMLGVETSRTSLVTGREDYYNSLPPNSGDTANFWRIEDDGKTSFDFGRYNLYRKYGSGYQTAFTTRSLQRLKSWGFNTIGPGSDDSMYQTGQLPYTLKIYTYDFPTRLQTPFAYWYTLPDAFASDYQSWMVNRFNSLLAPHRGRSAFMGVFVDGEPSWGLMDTPKTRYQIAVAALNAQYSQPAKIEFLRQLQAKYPTVQLLNTAWGTSYSSWTSLHAPNNFTRETLTTQCQDDMRAFVTSFATAYFSKVKAALNAAGSTGLYLGSREQWPTPESTAAAMPYVDTYSVTLYFEANKIDWTFPESTRPVFISEFSFGATDRGSFHPGPMGAHDQAARAQLLRDYALAAVRAPKVAGIIWFEYFDQPTVGRVLDGQNQNFGFLSVADTPFPEMRQAARNVGYSIYMLRGR